MTRRRDQPVKRLLGTVVGSGFCLFGVYTVPGSPRLPDRARWVLVPATIFGIAAGTVGATVALTRTIVTAQSMVRSMP